MFCSECRDSEHYESRTLINMDVQIEIGVLTINGMKGSQRYEYQPVNKKIYNDLYMILEKIKFIDLELILDVCM